MSQQSAAPGYYAGPGGSSKPPDNGFNAGKLLDPGNFTGIGNKGAPPPIDYSAAAEATSQSGRDAANQTTLANRPNQQTGFGSQQWTKDASGNWTQNTQLNGPLGSTLGNLQNQAHDNSVNGPQNIADARNQAIGANYNQATSRLNPQWGQAAEQNQSQLVNQGLDPSSQAYQSQMNQFNQARNDAYSSAMNNAIGMGNQTQMTQLGAQMAPYQQMQFLQGYQNGMPGFNAAQQYQGTDYLKAAEAAGGILQSQNESNQKNSGDMMSGAGALGAAMFASDERVKTDIHRLPVEAAPGIPAATFRYKHDPTKTHHIGVIAQDVEKVSPQHVHAGPDGIKKVNYGAFKPFGFK